MKSQYFYLLIFLIIVFLTNAAGVQVFSSKVFLFPELLLLATLIFALNFSFGETLWFAFGVGFFAELFSGSFFGGEIVAFVCTGLLVYFITRNLTSQHTSFLTAVFVVALASVSFALGLYAYNSLIAIFNLTQYIPFGNFISTRIFWTILVNLIVFYPMTFIFKVLQNERSI